MKVGILETGRPPGDLAARFGTYPDMFAALLGEGFETAAYDVAGGALPAPSDHEAWIVTGSPAGVHEDHEWIAPLMRFVRRAENAKLVGICFGHQIMAQALGGHVERSDKGWGIGLHTYPMVSREPWMERDGASAVAIPASHRDQVVMQPPGTEVAASSLFTPYAALAWTGRPAISFQFHPEFPPDFARALIESRRHRLPDPDAAIASLDAPNDNARVGGWIRRFLRG